MKETTITVTEAARNFADCVNRAHYQNTTFVLLKNASHLPASNRTARSVAQAGTWQQPWPKPTCQPRRHVTGTTNCGAHAKASKPRLTNGDNLVHPSEACGLIKPS